MNKPSVRKRGRGWDARWTDATGARRSKRLPTKDQAYNYAAEMQRKANLGEELDYDRKDTTVGELAEEWLRTRSGVKAKTLAGYEAIVRRHVLPAFGDTPARLVKKPDIKRWIADKQKAGVGAGTIRNSFRNVLKPIFNHAVDERIITTNPANGVRPPQSERQEMVALTAGEVRAVADAITPHYRTLILTAAYTGLRFGELMALQVKHVDLMAGRVRVERSVNEVKGELVYGKPKTKTSLRSVPLPAFLVDLLAGHVADRADDPEALVFVTPEGEPIRHSKFYGHFKAAAKDTLTKPKQKVRFHDLRHTCASLLIAEGANPKQIQAMLGHSSVALTFDVYGHLFDGHDEELADALDGLYRESDDGAEVIPMRKAEA